MKKNLAQNRKARHVYHVLETIEAGLVLTGTEVKSCRAGGISLAEAYAKAADGELWLVSAHIAPYEQGNRNNHAPRRDRKLLLHKREIERLSRQVESKGLTLIPLSVYLSRGKIKLQLGLCRGKNVRDKRQDLKKRADEREARRMISRAKS